MPNNPHPHPGPADSALTAFAARAPSTAWERVSLPECAFGFAWAWFKPPTAPGAVLLRLPDQSSRADQSSAAPALRHLLQSVGIDLADVEVCYLYGIAVDPRAAGAPLDGPLEPPPPGADPNIVVMVSAGLHSSPQSARGAQKLSAIRPETAHIYHAIDADWDIALQLEKQLVILRKRLSTMLARLGTLDRDLTTEERLHGDRQAKTDWQEARRWLKDAAARLARYIKEHDLGETSAAGKRLQLQQIFETIVAPRNAVDNIVELHREFEAYRKRLQILLNNMNTAHNGAAQDGERRAQDVMRRISGSVRNVRAKKRGRNEDFAKLKPKQLDH